MVEKLLDKIKNFNKTGELFWQLLSDNGVSNIEALYGVTMATYLANPDIFVTKPAETSIELADKVKIGASYIKFGKKANCEVVVDCDYDKLQETFEQMLKNCKTQTNH